MPSRREQIAMSEDEVDAFLDEQRTLIVATLGPSGHPHVVPMWYVLLEGQVAFWTYGRAQKVRNLRRDPRITCLVETGDTYDQLRGVQLIGTGVLHDDPDEVLEVAAALRERYWGEQVRDEEREGMRASAAKRLAVTVEVEDVVSWDHRKLGGVY